MAEVKSNLRRVLIIAGSDPSGGAGIQADIKAVTCLGGYAMTAITALTVQNTLGVTDVLPINEAFVTAQARACIDDIGVDAIKTGMLGNQALVAAVCDILEGSPEAFKVIDPVMVAKGGHKLLPDEAVSMIRERLIPLADLITPNAPEAEALTGFEVRDEAGMLRAGHALLAMGAKAVLLKGGHVEGTDVIDMLFTEDGRENFSSPRIETVHTHGTGCTLASACATLVRPDNPLGEAVNQARAYVYGAIENAPRFGGGHGPLMHNWQL